MSIWYWLVWTVIGASYLLQSKTLLYQGREEVRTISLSPWTKTCLLLELYHIIFHVCLFWQGKPLLTPYPCQQWSKLLYSDSKIIDLLVWQSLFIALFFTSSSGRSRFEHFSMLRNDTYCPSWWNVSWFCTLVSFDIIRGGVIDRKLKNKN